MSEITVSRLNLRAQDGAHWGAQQRLERALASISVPDRKVYAVRRLPTIRTRMRPGPFEAQRQMSELTSTVADTLAPILAGAIHGSQTGAAGSNAVWFKDLVEAKAHFLALVAHGHLPRAWFWRSLLGQDWLQPEIAVVVAREYQAIQHGAADAPVALAVLLRAIGVAGLEPVAALVAGSLHKQARFDEGQSIASSPQESTEAPDPGSPSYDVTLPSGLNALATMVATRSDIRAIAERAHTDRRIGDILVIACRLVILQHRPSLLETNDIVMAVAHRAARSAMVQRSGQQPSRFSQISPRYSPATELPGVAKATPGRPAKPSPSRGADNPPERSLEASDTTGVEIAIEHAEPTLDPAPLDEPMLVEGAGLLLAIPSLIRLGFPEWLDINPRLRHADFARQFILDLVLRYAPGSAVPMARWLGQNEDGAVGPPTRASAQAMLAWRVGLDRFLRRRAKTRLHDLASDRATLVLDNEIWRCRFPISAIRMGLRREALDRDPGWIPWLGLSLRYEFIAGPDAHGGIE